MEAQDMRWIPSANIASQQCDDKTDCSQNLVCYSLTYMPTKSGVLTSYTTGFTLNCSEGTTAIVYNASCTMTDKSEQVSACEEAGKLLLLCSGNTGELAVNARKRVVLHQVCVQTSGSTSALVFEPNEIVGLTASLDNEQTGPFTERMLGDKFYVPSNYSVCNGGTVPNGPEGTIGVVRGGEGEVSLELFPNPVVNNLQVRVILPVEKAVFNVLDVNGRVLVTRVGNTGIVNQLDVSALPSGTYFLAVGEDRSELTKKFVIVR